MAFSVKSGLGTFHYPSPYFISPLCTSVALVVDCTPMTRASLVQMIIAATHESSAGL